MSKNAHDTLRGLLSTILRIPLSSIRDDAALGVTPGWDSLSQLDVLAALEQESGVLIEPDVAVELTSFNAIVKFLEPHERD